MSAISRSNISGSSQSLANRRWRMLPPAGGLVSASDMIRVLRAVWQTPDFPPVDVQLAHRLNALTQATAVELWSSGTAALRNVLRVLKAQKQISSVTISAYNCPDVAVAALEAGLRVQLCDVDPSSLAPVSVSDGGAAECVVLTNLYGMQDDIADWKADFIVDDLCQAALTSLATGFSKRAVSSVFSFGRGKAIAGVGGGAAISYGENDLPVGSISNKSQCCINSMRRELNGLVSLFGQWIFRAPSLYRVLSNIPALGLGETQVTFGRKANGITAIEALAAFSRMETLDSWGRLSLKNSKRWQEIVSGTLCEQPIIVRGQAETARPIRYPILLESEKHRDDAFTLLNRAGLGASRSYPKPLDCFEQLNQAGLSKGSFPGAKSVSERILTLPVHDGVKEKDFELAEKILKTLKGVKSV